jgi:hypothetical protein
VAVIILHVHKYRKKVTIKNVKTYLNIINGSPKLDISLPWSQKLATGPYPE